MEKERARDGRLANSPDHGDSYTAYASRKALSRLLSIRLKISDLVDSIRSYYGPISIQKLRCNAWNENVELIDLDTRLQKRSSGDRDRLVLRMYGPGDL
jgi:hypothetical protein